MTVDSLSRAYISIIISSVVTFISSRSHLTIYGVSILGSLYLSMIRSSQEEGENPPNVFYVTAISGLLLFVFWKPIHSWGTIFHCLPGRIHASLVFGILLLVLTRVLSPSLSSFPLQSRALKHSSLWPKRRLSPTPQTPSTQSSRV